uniref:Uncharacterized protein n=1 Tax=Anguilla anguilla TaxID=7936 RepID=A0A0E9PN92_ANGAN
MFRAPNPLSYHHKRQIYLHLEDQRIVL